MFAQWVSMLMPKEQKEGGWKMFHPPPVAVYGLVRKYLVYAASLS